MNRTASSAEAVQNSRMDFRFANLLGAPYRGGNILLAGTELLSPVGNRVSQVCIDTAPLSFCSLHSATDRYFYPGGWHLTIYVCVQIDLTSSTSSTLPFEALKQVSEATLSC